MKNTQDKIQALDKRLENFKILLEDQMIALKYGKGYKSKFMDNLLNEVGRL